MTAQGLIQQAQSGSVSALQSALIAAAVSLLVAVFTQLSLSRRDRQERLYQRRRTALLDVQNAALALRQALADFGELARATPGYRSAELIEAERRFDRTSGLLEVMLSRVADAEVAELVNDWRRIAQVSSISVQDEVSRPDEQRAWAALNSTIGNALGQP
ncbi:MAG: hypothetical protein ACJ74U_19850 [Jatrophihabitantaceae bacterium]